MNMANNIVSSWPAELSESYKKEGFENVTTHRHPISSDIREFFTQMQFMVAEEFSYVAMDNSDPNTGGYEHRRRIQEAAKQAVEGAAMHFNLEVTVGQKPL